MDPQQTERNIAVGKIAAKVLASRVWADDAATMHAEVAAALEAAGLFVIMEYPTRWLGDVRKGRIDIVVQKALGQAAIELDCRKPRRRSVLKLRLFPGYRIVGIRGIEGFDPVIGIDEIVSMRVRVAKPHEKADRRTVNREAA